MMELPLPTANPVPDESALATAVPNPMIAAKVKSIAARPARHCLPCLCPLTRATPGHLLQSVNRTMHSPFLPFSQSLREASRAETRSLREAAPMNFPSSVDANAAHIPEPARMMTLQPLAPHSPNAASSARFCVGWFQLQPRLPVCLSHAIAPYSAARAGTAVSRIDPNPTRTGVASIARRIKVFSIRSFSQNFHGCPVQHLLQLYESAAAECTTFDPPWPDLFRPPTSSPSAPSNGKKAWMAGPSHHGCPVQFWWTRRMALVPLGSGRLATVRTREVNAMLHKNSVFHQLLKHMPWPDFERLVAAHGSDAGVRRLTTKSQFLALLYGQLAGAASLREIVGGMQSHRARLYHLGAKLAKRSTLADANRDRASGLFTDLLELMIARAHRGLRRSLAETTYLVDATALKLDSRSLDWARFSEKVCGAKLHVVYDADADRPIYAAITAARVNDITAAQCRIVTRLKSNTPLAVVEQLSVPADTAILSDQIGHLPARQSLPLA